MRAVRAGGALYLAADKAKQSGDVRFAVSEEKFEVEKQGEVCGSTSGSTSTVMSEYML